MKAGSTASILSVSVSSLSSLYCDTKLEMYLTAYCVLGQDTSLSQALSIQVYEWVPAGGNPAMD